jgi:hypothetical protein
LGEELLFVCQMIQHVSALVDLAALDRRRFARVLLHGRGQGLAAVQNIEPRFGEIESAIHQIAEQLSPVAKKASKGNARQR